ncbi:hypothetical protein K1T71_001886 [Dendrolimus kikuchii]|uniref:Uncharacterized protein n=1 Tax=Dendrolimus kikuchii TaxID=765133 RepID=A0ACC1DFW7_9NEOP|nr:hypothetical protein K1T71_001886 [Dendrolimus kikuchii]
MQNLLLLVLLVIVSASLSVEIDIKRRYHQEVGIPLARHIKITEEATSRNRRAIGGGPASLHLYPYVAGLLIDLEDSSLSLCSASLLNHQRLISAAHCWDDGEDQSELYTVVLGSEKLYNGGLRIKTSNVVVHPEWDPDTLLNDISIIYLPTTIQFTAKIRPVALPRVVDLPKTFTGYRAVIVGFGRTSDWDLSVRRRRVSRVHVKVITNKMCSIYYEHVPRSQICTSGHGRVGICNGDSGGPLITKTTQNDILIGVSSYSDSKGCQVGTPSGFTRVTEFYHFIKSHMS